MSDMRIHATVQGHGADVAHVDVALPLPKSWNPEAVSAVLPALTDAMVAVLQSWLTPDGEIVFEGPES